MPGPWEQFQSADAPVAAAPAAGPWEQFAAPTEKKAFGLGDTWPARLAKGVVESVKSAVTLPGDVYSGKTQVDPSNPEFIGRTLDLAGVGMPMSPAARIGEKAIAGVGKASVRETPPIPTVEAIGDKSTQQFNSAKNMGVKIDPAAVTDIGTQVEQKLQSMGIHEEHAPTTYKTLERLRNPPADSTATISDLHNLRQAFGNASGNFAYPKDTVGGSIGIKTLDKFLADIPEKAIVAGDAPAASATLKDAIGNAAAEFSANRVGARFTKAENAANRSRGTGFDDSIRTKLAPILDNKANQRGLTAQEIAQVQKIHDGTVPTNVAKALGKFGVKGALSLMLHTGAAMGTGGATIPVAIGGTVARKVADALSRRQANKLDEMIRARSPMARGQQDTIRSLTGGENAKRAAIVRALLASQHQQ